MNLIQEEEGNWPQVFMDRKRPVHLLLGISSVEGSLLLLTTQDTYLLPKYVTIPTMYIDIGTHAIYLFLTQLVVSGGTSAQQKKDGAACTTTELLRALGHLSMTKILILPPFRRIQSVLRTQLLGSTQYTHIHLLNILLKSTVSDTEKMYGLIFFFGAICTVNHHLLYSTPKLRFNE